jgi:hypothetical protein
MAQPGRLARLLAAPHALGSGPALENRNWKLEIQNWRQPEIENRQFILRPRSGKMDERKKFTIEATNLLKTKDHRTN